MTTVPDPLLAQLRLLYAAVVCDVLDSLGYRQQSLPHTIRPLTKGVRVCGRAFTVHARAVDAIPPEPYKLEMEAIDAAQADDVLITDVENNIECGFWGELMTTACRVKNVAGSVMTGCARDMWKLADCDFPVFGIGYHPADSNGRVDIDSLREPITIGSATIRQGDYILGDLDGIVVIPTEVADETIRLAAEKVSGENTARRDLEAGDSLSTVFRRYGIL